MHRKLLLCLALVGVALAAAGCVGGSRNGVLEGTEQCDPSSTVTDDSCCDKNCKFRLTSYVCSLGEKCFSQTYCNGHSESCPKEANFLPNADCAFGGECYAPPKCDGDKKDGSCLPPTPRTAESNYQCYTGVTADCTVDTYCDGESLDCPSHYAPSTLVCRSAEGVCDEDTHCPGVDADESVQEACPDTTYKTSECAAADPDNCYAASNCDGETADCPPAGPAGSDIQCSTETSVSECINGYMCNGNAGGADACEPVPADENSVCDSSAADPSSCQAASVCDGVSTGASACLTQAADSDVVCDSGSEDSETCTGVSYCSGNAIGVAECTPSVADSSVTCRSEDSCNYEKKCDGLTATCPESHKDDDTDCTASANCPDPMESAKCTSGVCGSCEHPDVHDDPMITGFKHQRFWFEAESGTIYNFFSQPGVEINALIKDAHPDTLKKMTAIGAIGFVTANNKVIFDAINGPLGKFIINGKNVTFNAKQNMMDIDDCVQMAWAPSSVLFSSAEFEIVMAFKAANPKEALMIPYINMKFVHVSGDVNKMSGIIGITARDAKSRQHGFEARVSDIVGVDAPLTTFTGASLSCEANMKRSDNQMGAATQHQLDDLKKFAYTWS